MSLDDQRMPALACSGMNNDYQDCEVQWLFLAILECLEVRTVAVWSTVIRKGYQEDCLDFYKSHFLNPINIKYLSPL